MEAKLWEQVKSDYPFQRKLAAGSPCATEAVLLAAMEDEDADIRREAARNPYATEAVLLKALNDAHPYVRHGAMLNRGVINQMLAAKIDFLGGEKSIMELAVQRGLVKEGVRTEDELLAQLDDNRINIQRDAADSPYATEAVLLKAVNSDALSVALAAVKNNNATETVLMAAAAASRHLGVRIAAAQSSNATQAVIGLALQDENPFVVEAAKQNAQKQGLTIPIPPAPKSVAATVEKEAQAIEKENGFKITKTFLDEFRKKMSVNKNKSVGMSM